LFSQLVELRALDLYQSLFSFLGLDISNIAKSIFTKYFRKMANKPQ